MERYSLDILVEKVSTGDKNAFRELCELKYAGVFYQAYTILGNHHDAEDVAQNVMIIMYEKIGTLRSKYAFSAWLHRLVANECSTVIKGRTRRKEDFSYDEETDLREENAKDWLPEENIENMEFEKILSDIIDRLPKKRRRAVVLYYYEDLSYKEIAEVMDSTVSTVSTNIMRAREDIKNEMKRIADIDLNFEDKEQNDDKK